MRDYRINPILYTTMELRYENELFYCILIDHYYFDKRSYFFYGYEALEVWGTYNS